MKRRNFLGFTAALGASAFAPSLFAKENFTMWGMPAIPNVILAVASLQGELAKGRDVSLKIWRTPDQMRAGIANGSIKLTAAPSNVCPNLNSQGLNFKMLNIMTKGLLSILAKNDEIKSIEDIVDKKIVMPFKGDMPDLIMQAVCKKRGINFAALDISFVQTPPEAVGLFLAKDYDVALTLEPMSSVAVLRGKKSGINVVRALELAQVWGESFGRAPVIPQAGLIVQSEFYEANRALFQTLHSDMQNALEWIMQNKQSAAEIGANYLPAPVPVLASAFEKANLTVAKASDMAEELMAFYEELYALNPKFLGGKMPDEKLFL